MAERLTFQQFKDKLENSTEPIENLDDYVEFAPDSPIPKLKYRDDAPLDGPVPDVDVNSLICKYSRKIREKERDQTSKILSENRISIVAEGDSWFNLPDVLPCCAPAIANCLDLNPRFQMKNIAIWGDTLQNILDEKEYMNVIKDDPPDYFMLSAGGNDLVLGLAEEGYVHQYDSSLKPEQYLTEVGEQGINDIQAGYKQILGQVTKTFGGLKVLCHGYDYPRPRSVKKDEVEDGPEDNPADDWADQEEDKVKCDAEFIGNHLHALGIPYKEMDAILRPIIDKLNKAIEDAVAKYKPQVEFINLRDVASKPEIKWYDDMHPAEDGFKALAAKFEEAMSETELLV